MGKSNTISKRPATTFRIHVCVLMALLMPAPVLAQNADPATDQTKSGADIDIADSEESKLDEVIDEIIIIETRPSFRIEADIRKADIEMYTIFNVLNENKLYDIHCNWEDRYDSRNASKIRRQICKPQYERGIDEFQWKGAGNAINIDPSIMIPRSEIRRREKILRQKMLDIASENPQFAAALLKRARLQQEYIRSRRRSME